MSTHPTIPVFDGHNDTLLSIYRPKAGEERDFFTRSEFGHIDLPRAREGSFAGGFFAVYVPAQFGSSSLGKPPESGPYEAPLPDPLDPAYSLQFTLGMAATLFRIEAESQGQFRVTRDVAAIEQCLADGAIAAIFHIEGAEAIDPDLHNLYVLHQAGLRSIGPVWSRSNIFGHGVPFAYPRSPDTGPGLTDAGKALIRACNELKIMIDLSHMTEAGFWDVAAISDAPLVATHSNVHALSQVSRNLTDKQLDAIRDSDGMVGLNFAVSFLREDGRSDPDTPLSTMVDHIDYLVEKLGIERVGFGSDFDGATMPRAIADVSGLPHLLAALRDRGYDDAALRKLAYENWLAVLRRTWG